MLTPDQIKQIAASRGDTVVNASAGQPTQTSDPAAEFAKSVGYDPTSGTSTSSDTPDAKPGLFERLGADFNKRVNSAADAQVAAINGDESNLQATAHTIGQGAGMVLDTAKEGLESAASFLPNKDAENAALANDPIVKLGAHALQIGGDLWKSFEQAHPKAADYISSLGNVASILPIGAGIKIGTEEAANLGAQGAARATEAATETANTLKTKVPEAIDSIKSKAGDLVENAQLAATKSNQIPTLETAARNPIPFSGSDKVLSPLKRYDEHVATAQSALRDAKADTPLGKVGSEIGDAFDQVVKDRKNAGEKMSSELEKIGEKKTDTSSAIGNLQAELGKNGLFLSQETGKLVRGSTSKLTDSDVGLISDYTSNLKTLGPSPTVAELDAFLSRIPEELKVYKAKNNITGTTNAERIVKNNLAQLRTQFEPVSTGKPYLKDYAAARKQYADLSKFLEEGIPFLGKKTSAGDYAKDASLAKSSVQSVLNGGKKDWLVKLEQLTGYPAIDDATLALQSMKDAGDYRGASLLETLTQGAAKGELPHVPTSATGIINEGLGRLLRGGAQQFTGTPIEQTRRYLQSLEK